MADLIIMAASKRVYSPQGSWCSQMTPKPYGDGIARFSTDHGKTWTTEHPYPNARWPA